MATKLGGELSVVSHEAQTYLPVSTYSTANKLEYTEVGSYLYAVGTDRCGGLVNGDEKKV